MLLVINQVSAATFFCHNCVVRRGSPLLVGIKSESPLKTDRLPIVYSSGKYESCGTVKALLSKKGRKQQVSYRQ